ncbi:FAD binding domain protein [Aspergillus heteromorphus CBS 117.55]|uniref:FAD binding domain protein n=1 Tax=Aspergillus heteromorphus CBS 117.55 TaxID=1448321 RepID=A0A317WIZ0_9EURO|nr:FAD binding domain protein [Aspergillus heteromorphus CBS 117.55]PWY85028.1 FAD binding domain protein [Aspergillus heteromorphus CBS 117.55]
MLLPGALFVAALLSGATALDNTTSHIVAKLASYGVNAYDYFNGSVLSESSLQVRSLGLCSVLCSALPLLYPDQVLLRSEAAYATWDASFWSQQQEDVDPACVFQPVSTVEVAIGLLLTELTECPFAVKSGGHAAFAGASNIQDGLTIDLVSLNTTTLSDNSSIASVGPGNRWLNVYDWLETYGLSVIGGRVSDIGVGGLTLGGGISFFSGFHGWACDNVANYEVVLADGSIVEVNLDTYPDLYWALRGGGNNFGIVTRFDLTTHEQGLMWGGSRVWLDDSQASILEALINFGENSPSDPNAALIVSIAYAEGLYLIVADLEYAEPVVNPPIFDAFNGSTALEDTMAIRSLSNITLLFKEDNPNGLRESYWTGTVQLDLELATNITNMFKTELVPIQNVTGLIPALVWQVISTNTMEHMTKNGGNALGLDAADGPLLLINLAFMWDDESDDAAVMEVLGRMTQKALSAAKARGLGNEYLYMNYASQYQSVAPSYGTANHARLQAVSQKYDPLQVFQNLQPGYFKLDGKVAL